MNGLSVSLSQKRLNERVRQRYLADYTFVCKPHGVPRTTQAVCRHWTLDRLPARGFSSEAVSLAMALVKFGRVFVQFRNNPSGHRPKILACLCVLELLETSSCNSKHNKAIFHRHGRSNFGTISSQGESFQGSYFIRNFHRGSKQQMSRLVP